MISLNWVKDYVDLTNEDLEELAVKVTKAGVNVEKVINNRISNLVIGKIVACEPHPNSDHLKICTVDIGSEKLQIVCGAPNAREGIKVIVALPGAVLPGDFEIKVGKIRDVESNGMLCALFELGLEEKTDENYAKGIHEVGEEVEIGLDANIYLNNDDVLYELDVHKHRNNDCYYHIGFAYEIACILNKKVTLPPIAHQEIAEKVNDNIQVTVDTALCPYYSAKMVRDVEIKESPDFIKQRLINAGMRPINNVVDISNYVMLEFGQPLHFFDKDYLGDTIVVRQAHDQEKIITLDKQERVLTKNDIVITDGQKPVCIAGVMGGENTEVLPTTKNILIESAIFDAVAIRNTASRLNLKSEASIRYGKGLNYEYTNMAIERACYLLEKYADAKVLSGTVIYDKVDKTDKVVKFQTAGINKILGINLNDEDVKTELNRLDFPYQYKDKTFTVTIPKRRLDIDANINDIAEEIGRLYGYHNLVSTLPTGATRQGKYIGDVKIRKETSKRLRTLGLNECKTYTLVSPEMADLFKYEQKENVVLPNPMSSDKSLVRTTIIPSLLNVYEYNTARNVKNIMLYEISKTYDVNFQEDLKVAILMKGSYLTNDWQRMNLSVDFYLIKGVIENLLDYLGFKNRYSFVKSEIANLHPGISVQVLVDREPIGIIGKIHPNLKKADIYVAELSLTSLYQKSTKPLKFKSASKYPEIIKDMAFVVDNEIDSETIKNVIKKEGGRILASVEVFDLYPNYSEGKKSIAFKLVFKDENKTLVDNEVMEIFNKIINKVTTTLPAILRDK